MRINRYFLAVPLVLFCGIMGAVFVNQWQYRDYEVQKARQTLQDFSRKQVRMLNVSLNGQFELLEAFAAAAPSQGSLAQKNLVPRMRAVIDVSIFERLFVMTSDGVIVSGSGQDISPEGQVQMRRVLAEGKNIVARVDSGENGDGPRFILATPIRIDGAIIGAVGASYTERALRSLLVSESFGGEGYSLFCDAQGNIVIGSDQSLVDPQHAPKEERSARNLFEALRNATTTDGGETLETTRRNMAEQRGGHVEYSLDGDRCFAVYEPIHINDWFVWEFVPYVVIERTAAQDAHFGWLGMGTILVLSLLSTVLLIVGSYKNLHAIRLREELFNAAAQHGSRALFTYDIAARTVIREDALPEGSLLPQVIEDVPEGILRSGLIDPRDHDICRAFFAKIQDGEKTACFTYRCLDDTGACRWFAMEATTLFDAAGRPVQAVISALDVTEQREKEIAYDRWRKSTATLEEQTFRLYEYNLTTGRCARSEGGLFAQIVEKEGKTLDERAGHAAEYYAHPDDRQALINFLNRDRLVAAYHRNQFGESLDVRMINEAKEYVWVRLTVHMVPYPQSKDIRLDLLVLDIDEQKREEMSLRLRSEEDSLTRVLNRDTFISRVGRLFAAEAVAAQHALIMIDVDNFKTINDTLGHTTGDQALIAVADVLRTGLRQGDLLGRVGGDEFLICLKDIPYPSVVEKRAQEIRSRMRRHLSKGVDISGSIGISLFPHDGLDFPVLYERADAAMYTVKKNGGDGVAFYSPDMEIMAGAGTPFDSEGEDPAPPTPSAPPESPAVRAFGPLARKNTLLIVDDSDVLRDELRTMLFNDYHILMASGGFQALQLAHRYGQSIAVMLLDIKMPFIDGLEVLRRMDRDGLLSLIPVIVMSAEEQYGLESLELGASDFVGKPFRYPVLKMRLKSAIQRKENERLQAQNSYLLLQSEEEERYRTVLDSTGTVIFEYDWITKNFVYDRLASTYLAGTYNERPLWVILLLDMVAASGDVKLLQNAAYEVAMSRGTAAREMTIQLKTPAGEKHWFRVRIVKLLDRFGLTRKLLFTFNDIHTEKIASEQLHRLAERDQLTDLYNRETFVRRAGECITAAPSSSFMMVYVNIDNFKTINDLFGHEEGNRLLRHIAVQLSGLAGEASLCSRLSSDCFAVLYPYKDNAYLAEMSRRRFDRIRDFNLPFEIVSRSGIYVIDDPAMPVEAMLDRAALAYSSIRGKYGVYSARYDEALRERFLEKQEIINMMTAAVEREQFIVHLQPQYNYATRHVIGAEALVRWAHPDRGLIPPAEFIPVFEENDFIFKLDMYVCETVCRMLRSWLNEGYAPVPVGVNISRMDVYHANFISILTMLTSRYAIPPGLLKLEITESAYTVNPGQIVTALEQVHALGHTIEMDDFGSGYSSLNNLKNLPIDTLKLDMNFLSAEDRTGRGGDILHVVIHLARELDLQLISEGVETREQAEHLLEHGCEIMQGYYFGKPMSIQDFAVTCLQPPAQD